jgi:hypothetical protein
VTSSRFDQAIAAIDAVNADDPHDKEPLHARLVTEWVRRLRPDAGEELLLAARAHHIRRWAIPRSSYPDGRAGYLRWRRDLHQAHARDVAEILTTVGYDGVTVARVQDLVRKKGLGKDADADVQALEDALCLVFIETQFRELADRLEPDKMVDVTRKTLVKMSDDAKTIALSLDLPPEDRAVLELALA